MIWIISCLVGILAFNIGSLLGVLYVRTGKNTQALLQTLEAITDLNDRLRVVEEKRSPSNGL